MKRNVKYKILIAAVLLVLLAVIIAAFFMGRSGNGGIQSAYDYSVTRTTTQVTAEKTKKADAKKTDTKATTKKTTLASGKKTVTIPGVYAGVLSKYQEALNGKWGVQALRRAGLSTLLPELYEGKPLENIGFLVEDFNGDGDDDLIIGVMDGYKHYPYAVLDYYTLDNNGDLYNLFQSQPKDYYAACTKARFLEKATDGNNYTAWYLYGLNSNGMAMTFKEGLLRDRIANAEKPWYQASDLDGDTSNDKHVKNNVGTARQKQLDNARIQLKYISFAKFATAKPAK